MQYLKRKGSQIIAPLTKRARKASIPQPHTVTPTATGVTQEYPSTDVGSDQTLRFAGTRMGRAISGIEGAEDHLIVIEWRGRKEGKVKG